MWKMTVARALYPSIFEERDQYFNEMTFYKDSYNRTKQLLELNRSDLSTSEKEGIRLSSELEKCRQIAFKCGLNAHLSDSYKSITDLVYKQKRKHQNKPISIRINDMIHPQFESEKVKKRIKKSDDLYCQIVNYGNWVARNITWTDDKTLDGSGDYYLYPEEIIATKKGDCEDHSFLMASFDPENIGVVYGYFINGNGKKYGHAWNCFLYDSNLYILETTNKSAEVYNWDNESYIPHYIIMQDSTFQLKGGVAFGNLAQW